MGQVPTVGTNTVGDRRVVYSFSDPDATNGVFDTAAKKTSAQSVLE